MSVDTTPSARFYDWLAWAEVNKKKLIYFTAGLIVVGIAIAVFRWKSEQAELRANQALLKLQLDANEQERQASSAAYLKVAAEFPGTQAGERAALMAAAALFEEAKYAEAQAQFEKWLAAYPNSALAPSAALGIAASLEAQNKTNETLMAYQGVLTRYPQSAVAAQAKLGLARLHEAKNQPELALKIYDELIRTNQFTSWGSEAVNFREQLLKKYPGLTPTNVFTGSLTNLNLNRTNQTTRPLTNLGGTPKS